MEETGDRRQIPAASPQAATLSFPFISMLFEHIIPCIDIPALPSASFCHTDSFSSPPSVRFGHIEKGSESKCFPYIVEQHVSFPEKHEFTASFGSGMCKR